MPRSFFSALVNLLCFYAKASARLPTAMFFIAEKQPWRRGNDAIIPFHSKQRGLKYIPAFTPELE